MGKREFSLELNKCSRLEMERGSVRSIQIPGFPKASLLKAFLKAERIIVSHCITGHILRG